MISSETEYHLSTEVRLIFLAAEQFSGTMNGLRRDYENILGGWHTDKQVIGNMARKSSMEARDRVCSVEHGAVSV